MTRPLRIEFEGAVYHITSRGNAKQDVYLGRTDRIEFLKLLEDTVCRFHWICHAYCLMNNHYHLLIETPLGNLSQGMRHLNGVYTQNFNHRHERVGHLFQGRFKSILVEKETHLLELTRYIVLNPVRAGFVRTPELWPWSSYRVTAGFEKKPEFLETLWLLSQFDDDPQQAMDDYRAFVAAGVDANPWEKLKGSILGSERYIQKMEPYLKDKFRESDHLRREVLVTRPSLEQLFSGDDNRDVRNVKIFEAVRVYGYKLREVADHLGLHYTTVSLLAKRVAERENAKSKDLTPRGSDFAEELEPDRQCQK